MAWLPSWYRLRCVLANVNQANLTRLGYDFATGASELKSLYKVISVNLKCRARTTASWDKCTHFVGFLHYFWFPFHVVGYLPLVTHTWVCLREGFRHSFPHVFLMWERENRVLRTLVRNIREAYVTHPHYIILLRPLKFILCEGSSDP